MGNSSIFESRYGKVSCSSREIFDFVTDARNFGQFVPEDKINSWKAEKESCSFSVPMVGTVAVRLSEKSEFTKVVYEGDALKKEDFILTLNIYENINDLTGFNVILTADLNPMMKMVAIKPINQFLEMLVTEMEKFTGWKEAK